jgi:hypothetical protein
MNELSTMVELTPAELDAVAAGAPPVVAIAGGLVAAAAAINVKTGDILSDNEVKVGDVAVGVLSIISQ